jgi:AcrR family transcriptional regulator
MARKQGSHSDITGPKIRAAARRLIAAEGYAAVSMRQIAAEVGLQAGALYLYTPDKQGLLVELMRSHLEEVMAGWEAIVLPEGPLERLEAFVRFHLRFHLARPEAVAVVQLERRSLSPDNLAAIEALAARYMQVLENILDTGHGENVFQIPDTKVTTLAVMAMLTGGVMAFREEGRLSRGRVERIYWNLIRRAVGG